MTFALAAGCASGPVYSTKDPRVDLGAYHTYQWITPAEAGALRLNDPQIDFYASEVHVARDPELENKLRPVVERELRQKGYAPASSGTPDFYVTYYGQRGGGEWISTWQGSSPGIENVPVVIFPDFDRSQAFDYRDGTVYLTFYDARTKMPAWTGALYRTERVSAFDEQKASTGARQLIEDFQKSS